VPQRIAILPENITNKIAAGEVVERPSSVIKELVENALDAGATEIAVETAGGGKRLIRVTDNGHGMSREDALLSLERHATSKIRSDSDLEGISTLGFRGEALPTIASVSRFRLASREAGSLEGTEIVVEGGRIRDVRACGMAVGTVISVEQLFFNTPARLKFLRSAETEAAHAGDALTRMAISSPEVAFTWIAEGREQMRTQRGNLLRRLSQTLGRNTADHLHELSFSGDGISVRGFVSSPKACRSATSAMFTYINGRFVRDRVIQHAIMQAYRGVIDRGRYPVVALFMELAPGEVDVNVHPTKHEVRFRRQTVVHDTLQSALEGLLRKSPWLDHGEPRPISPSPTPSQAYRERIAAAAQASLGIVPRQPDFSRNYRAGSTAPTPPAPATPSPQNVSEPDTPFRPADSPASGGGYFSSLGIIGQFQSEYILCQSDHELIIIDQHAASERVAFQRLIRQFEENVVESQRLLFPETLELSFSEAEAVRRFSGELNRLGLEVESFGGNTVILTAIPRLADGNDCATLVRDILAELTQLGATSAFLDIRDRLLSRIACHGVVRGARQMEKRQIGELLRSMDETDFAATCPHGRPVSHVITLAELEKIFKRI